jgi:hypothetical protein
MLRTASTGASANPWALRTTAFIALLLYCFIAGADVPANRLVADTGDLLISAGTTGVPASVPIALLFFVAIEAICLWLLLRHLHTERNSP